MERLLNARETISKYNEMDFDTFVKKYEKFYGVTIPESKKKKFIFTGLNNVAFLDTYWAIIGIGQ